MTDDTAVPLFAEPHVSAAIIDVVARTEVPVYPVDGDCLIWAPRITKALHDRAVHDAETVWVVGKSPSGVVMYIHQATRVYGLIIDVTAQQFAPSIPPRWLAEEASYVQAMKRETDVDHITVTTGNPLA